MYVQGPWCKYFGISRGKNWKKYVIDFFKKSLKKTKTKINALFKSLLKALGKAFIGHHPLFVRPWLDPNDRGLLGAKQEPQARTFSRALGQSTAKEI